MFPPRGSKRKIPGGGGEGASCLVRKIFAIVLLVVGLFFLAIVAFVGGEFLGSGRALTKMWWLCLTLVLLALAVSLVLLFRRRPEKRTPFVKGIHPAQEDPSLDQIYPVFLWTCRGRGPVSRTYRRRRLVYPLVAVLLTIGATGAVALVAGRDRSQLTMIGMTILVFLLTISLVLFARWTGLRSHAMTLAFFRDNRGRLYALDFDRLATIRLRRQGKGTWSGGGTEGQILNWVVDTFQRSKVLPSLQEEPEDQELLDLLEECGDEVRTVRRIRRGPMACRVYCQFAKTGNRSIVLPKSFEDFDTLLEELEYLERKKEYCHE